MERRTPISESRGNAGGLLQSEHALTYSTITRWVLERKVNERAGAPQCKRREGNTLFRWAGHSAAVADETRDIFAPVYN